ncbi:L-lactate dehydrogenase [Gracilibacillus boraciitolerans JCM 21714]|uniref:Lactate utilization protein C n=1 Tax=Gracilibacillus boraciitolerans JCM 21714 TaxID=1298598 RepID=W4VE28_9BACI|nr:lactate utilization protein C [Gracilibacillus boraciitolerans]GAE91452.1 L-lactate dehydrogenase [Gracilibacillus boraciitolerans JCM 21714]
MPKGNIINRESFLTNIREKIGGIAADKPVQKPSWSVSPQRNVLAGYDREQLITVLKEQCQNIHTDFFQTDLSQLTSTIESVMEQYQSKTVVYSDDNRFDKANISNFLAQVDSFKWDRHDRDASVEFAERADIGITFSDITLAESGTVVLLNDKGQGRSVSLLPANYIAIIPKSTIVKRMTQATDYIHQQVVAGEDIASCINFITGPSNSADIEMNLVVGVHGPIKAAYIVVNDL